MSFKQKLIFDATDVDVSSDNIGAYLRSADGTLLTHTTEGSKEALDVYIAGGDPIEVDLDHTEDSVRLGNGTDFFTSTTESGKIGLDVNLINPSIVVTATDLDIRDLDFNSDSVTAHQGGSWTVDVGNTVTVQATDLDIRDLDHASDSVSSRLFDAAGNGLTSTLVGSDQALDVNIVASAPLDIEDVALANDAILSTATALTAANTAESVVSSALSDRKYLLIHNNDNRVCYIGNSGVTAANGFPMSPSVTLELRAGAAVDVHFVSNKTGHDLRTLELA